MNFFLLFTCSELCTSILPHLSTAQTEGLVSLFNHLSLTHCLLCEVPMRNIVSPNTQADISPLTSICVKDGSHREMLRF